MRMPLAHELVANHARERPLALALEHGSERLTYEQLDAAARAFATELRTSGVAPGDFVAVHATRDAGTLVAMLGIWHCGAAYLPLDPALPAARRLAMLADARPRCLVVDAGVVPAGTGSTPLHPRPSLVKTSPAAAPETSGSADALAYVLYTSGSTGTPKGVLVDHAALAHRASIQLQQFDLRPGERVTQYTSFAWDASFFEILLAWGAGAALHLIPEAIRRSPSTLVRHLESVQPQAVFLPPAVLATLPWAPLPTVRFVMVGGDACSPALVDRWAPNRRFVNLYGPTEATVWMTTEECRPGAPVTLGHPIPGVSVVVVDSEGRTLPQGAVGEICIAGAGLARGYLNRPELTSERFVHHDAHGRVYRSGDRGRILPDGRIEMHGRLDDQVKIRGVRLELGEVEAALAALPGIVAAAVSTDADARGEKRLVAYVTMADTPPEALRLADEPLRRRIRQALLAHLPEPMLPSILIEMGALPRTANDKLDRRALPPPAQLQMRSVPIIETPRNETERLVAQAWTEELGLPALGLHENVFELGAHSLLAARVQSRLEASLGRAVDIVLLFDAPTVASLAARLNAHEEEALAPAMSAATEAGASRGAARRSAIANRRQRGTSPTPEDDDLDE